MLKCFDTIEKFRLHANRDAEGFVCQSLDIDRLAIANRLTGGLIADVIMIWDSEDIKPSDFWMFFTSNFKLDFEDYLDFINTSISTFDISLRQGVFRLYRPMRNLSEFEGSDRLTTGKAFAIGLSITVLLQYFLKHQTMLSEVAFPVSESLPIVQLTIMEHCFERTDLLNSYAAELKTLRGESLVAHIEQSFYGLRR